MQSRHSAQSRGILQAGKAEELRNVRFIEAAGFRSGDVGEPFQLGKTVREVSVLVRREGPFAIDTD